MKITKEMIPDIDRIELVLENCEEYEFKGEDIIDILFDDIRPSEYDSRDYTAHDGRLVLSKNTFNYLSSFAHAEYADGTTALDLDHEEYYYFYNRITRYCDVCQVHIYFKNGKKQWFFVEYDPIESGLLGYEIEHSNCHSAELDENGDMLLLFGKSSHTFHRIDNDYFNVVEGLKERLPKGINGILEIELETFGNGGSSCWAPDDGLYIEIRIQNKEYKNKWLPLQFFDVSKLLLDFDLKNMGGEELWISPTMDGRLFVQLWPKCHFYCKSIKVFEGF